MSPRVTVILPTYNALNTLERAAQSVLASDWTDFELIVVDDGSTDYTKKLLNKLAKSDARMRVLLRSHQGVSAARNVALREARGEYVMFIDADDEYLPQTIGTMVQAMENGQADVGIFAYYITHVGKPVAEFPIKCRAPLSTNAEIRQEYLWRLWGYSLAEVQTYMRGGPLIEGHVLGGVCMSVYRREVIERYQVHFDERITLFEDAFFNCEYLLHAERLVAVNEPLYRYTVASTGAMSSQSKGIKMFRGKWMSLVKRKEIDAAADHTLTDGYVGSCVFSLLQMLREIWQLPRVERQEARAIFRKFLIDPVVIDALRRCPLSWRRPLVSLTILGLRLRSSFAISACGVPSIPA